MMSYCRSFCCPITTAKTEQDASKTRRREHPAGTSCPLSKALTMPCRDEMSKRISLAFAVTERKENRTLREKYIDFRTLHGAQLSYARYNR